MFLAGIASSAAGEAGDPASGRDMITCCRKYESYSVVYESLGVGDPPSIVSANRATSAEDFTQSVVAADSGESQFVAVCRNAYFGGV